jgi:hypothetical protein
VRVWRHAAPALVLPFDDAEARKTEQEIDVQGRWIADWPRGAAPAP